MKAVYAALLVRGSTDAEHVIDASDKMVRALGDLKQGRANNHDRHYVEFWSMLIGQLQRVEYHLSHSGLDGTMPLTVLVSQANQLIITALRDGIDLGATVWNDAENFLSSAAVECLSLAEKVGDSRRYAADPPLSFTPFSEGSAYINSEELSAGLVTAARRGLDLNDLEIGQCAGEQVARVIRGKALR